jgi:hypothetical protein
MKISFRDFDKYKDNITDEQAEAIAKDAIEQALKGDPDASNFIADMLEGPVEQEVIINYVYTTKH